ncbi:MAG: LLM class F420-dependent oxidoreductase [Solirubrobacterales bacterium]|nr:LLM class F420-dependent oxidoreductase [Solirubrobacterales bacterium]
MGSLGRVPIRVGVQVQPQHASFDGMRAAWREADELGVDTIFTWDHFYPLSGEPEGRHFECLTTMASMAEVTERAQIGALVVCNSYRNPELLADAHRTIDHISGGRVILGIGAGWFQKDYDEYGYEFGTAPDRLRALRESLPRIRERLGKLNPPPVGRMPILIGGSGPKVTLRLVAEHADMWHSFGDADAFRAKDEVLREHCAKAGRDPSEIERTWGVRGDTLGHADDLADAGVQHLIMGIGGDGSGYDLGPLRELVAWRDRRNAAA